MLTLSPMPGLQRQKSMYPTPSQKLPSRDSSIPASAHTPPQELPSIDSSIHARAQALTQELPRTDSSMRACAPMGTSPILSRQYSSAIAPVAESTSNSKRKFTENSNSGTERPTKLQLVSTTSPKFANGVEAFPTNEEDKLQKQFEIFLKEHPEPFPEDHLVRTTHCRNKVCLAIVLMSSSSTFVRFPYKCGGCTTKYTEKTIKLAQEIIERFSAC